MDADPYRVGQVLGWNERFVVPLYQRKYEWHDKHEGGNVAALWNDVAAKAGDVLEGRKPFTHYMGALLLAPSGEDTYGVTSVKQVVDGQQRLTTFLLLVAALREVARRNGPDGIAERCNELLFNKPGPADKDELVRYKLVPTPRDREVFFDIMDMAADEVRTKYADHYRGWYGMVLMRTQLKALRAYDFLLRQIAEFVATGPGEDIDVDEESDVPPADAEEQADAADVERRLTSLLQAIDFHFKLIVITLGRDDDAQVIFKTLNSAGQPLLAMDLVRNDIFHRAEAQFAGREDARRLTERLYDDVWSPFDDNWWSESAPNARPRRPRIDHFLANMLTAETGDRTTVRELYAEYRAWASQNGRPRFENVQDELEVLRRYGPTYRVLEAELSGDDAIEWLGDRLRLWQNTTAYPIAFQIAGKDVDADTRKTVARMLDSYLTRRALCNLTPKNLNRIFPRLAAAFRDGGVSVETAARFFAGLDGPASRFPDDAEVRARILDQPIYDNLAPRIVADILWRLELAGKSAWSEAIDRPANLSVEHVLPKGWTTHWPLTNDAGEPIESDDPRFIERQSALHTLGNLTIVTQSLNTSMKHFAFAAKKEKLVEHSDFRMNRRIAERDEWDEVAIRERGEELATLALDVWPSLPEPADAEADDATAAS